MLGFYTYLSNITGWLRMQPDFPFKTYLLQLDSQTLQLVIFTILLFIILAKVKQNHDFVILQYVLCFLLFKGLYRCDCLVLLRIHNGIEHGEITRYYNCTQRCSTSDSWRSKTFVRERPILIFFVVVFFRCIHRRNMKRQFERIVNTKKMMHHHHILLCFHHKTRISLSKYEKCK